MFKDLKDKIQKLNKGNNTIINISTWIFIAVIVTFVFYLIWIGSQNIYYSLFNSEKAGQIGDSAGLLNSLFSGLAFLGVIVTIILQSKELKQTTTELKNQKEEFQIQNQTLKRQQFENTFFNMLKTQENIVSNLKIQIPDGLLSLTKIKYKDVVSRQVFEELYYILMKILVPFYATTFKKEEIIYAYHSCTKMKMLDHYFRHMYRIIKFVKETDFTFCLDEKDKNKSEGEQNKKIQEEKYKYTSILRATLSPYEIPLIFYNCLNKDNKFAPLIEEYHLLQNIRSEFLSKDILDFYKNDAYGNKYEDIKQEIEMRNN